jgi:DNA-binding response OmpR family regulator
VRLLIIEDDPLLARTMARLLEVAGHEIVDTAGSVAVALTALTAGGFEAAILDANLRRQSAAPIAVALKEKTVPFLVVTGYDAQQLDGAFSGVPCFTKPFAVDDLLAALDSMKR